MELYELETFLAVVEEGSFSRAAARLHRTQPAVSQTIRRLEEDLGEALFDRSSRQGQLTDAGALLKEYAEKLLNLRTEVRGALTELRSAERGRLAIAANEFTSLYLLPLLHEFRRACPMVHVSVTRSLASRVAEMILNHSVELGMLSFMPEDPTLRSVVVATDELAFVVHPKHPLAGAKKVSIKELGAQSFLAHHLPSPHPAQVQAAFQKHKTPLHMEVELPTLEAIRKFVAMGNGVALVPAVCVRSDVQRGELVRVPVPELQIERKIRIVYRKNATLSHAARAFLKVAEAEARKPGSLTLFERER